MGENKDKAFNAFINHLMDNKGTCCYAPSGRYCEEGSKLKQAYSLEVDRVMKTLRK